MELQVVVYFTSGRVLYSDPQPVTEEQCVDVVVDLLGGTPDIAGVGGLNNFSLVTGGDTEYVNPKYVESIRLAITDV